MMTQHPLHPFIRIPLVALLAVGLALALLSILDPGPPTPPEVFLVIGLGACLISEGNIVFHRLIIHFRKHGPAPLTARRILALHLLFSLLWTATISVLSARLFSHLLNNARDFQFLFIIVLLEYLLVMAINSYMAAFAYFRENTRIRVLLEEQQRNRLQADLSLLQEQLKPHFLFNTLNTLISEIVCAPDRAVTLAERMADFYRHVLQGQQRNTVTLREELNALDDYLYLVRCRMGEALNITLEIGETEWDHLLPPMSVQLLLENALKHNNASRQAPLVICIRTPRPGMLEIRNSRSPRTIPVSSTGTGLTNLNRRLELLGAGSLIIHRDENQFSVLIPLLTE